MLRRGFGGTLLILVLIIFLLSSISLISYFSSSSDLKLSIHYRDTVLSYYQSNLLAEKILQEIYLLEVIDDTLVICDTDVHTLLDGDDIIFDYSCPISDLSELYVSILYRDESHTVLEWKIRSISLDIEEFIEFGVIE